MEETLLDRGVEVKELKPIDPLKGRWQFLAIAMSLCLVPIAIETWLVYAAFSAFNAALNGDPSRIYTLAGIEKTEQQLMVFYYLLLVVSIVAVCMWVYRANDNLGKAGLKGIDQSPGMAVGWFFIPVANLFMPFNVMREIDQGSQSLSKPEEHRSWKNNKMMALLLIWFLSYVVSGLLLVYASFKTRMINGSAGMDAAYAFITVCYLSIIGLCLRLASGVALVLYTRKITQYHNNHIELTQN